jgi:hypothetical protein
MLRFNDFISKAHSAFEKQDDWRAKFGPEMDFVVPLLKESHIFLVGDDAEFNEALKEIDVDIREEMKDGVPMPFKDIAVCSLVSKPMEPDREKELHDTVRRMYPGQVEVSGDMVALSGGPVWVMDRLIEISEDHPAVEEIQRAPGAIDMSTVQQWFLMCRFHGVEGHITKPMVWAFGFRNVGLGGKINILTLATATPLGNEMAESCRYITAISHPAQYIVRVSPKLTQREQRRYEAGKGIPREKSSHFLVVDHEVIVGLRKDPVSTHASPVPHERRGHWARLAERCRHAKLLGNDKVWKKPTFVGERIWTDEKNLYEVLIDFGKKGSP